MKKKGLEVSISEGNLSDEMLRTGGREARVTVYTDPRTGTKIAPAPGWNYNPGRAAWQPDLDKYAYDVAKLYVAGGLTGPDFKRFYEGEVGGNFPVAVLDDEYRDLLAAKTRVINLSDETLAKNLRNHPELGLSDYQKLPALIAEADVVIEKGGQFLVFVRREADWYFSVVKKTGDGSGLYLISFRLTGAKDVAAEMKKGNVLRNKM